MRKPQLSITPQAKALGELGQTKARVKNKNFAAIKAEKDRQSLERACREVGVSYL